MVLARVVPSGIERKFGDEALIVSKTDTKGVIRYANQMFLRISGYKEADVMGQPHNMIRHPDMPRCVFKLLWDRISAGDELFAYIVNLAADGSHYWVYAHVTPSFGPGGAIIGYHSNRRAPNRGALAEVQEVYGQLRQAESAQSRGSDAIAAGMARLTEFLAERGQTYDQWVWDLTNRTTGGVS